MRLRPLVLLVASLGSTGCLSHIPIEDQIPHAVFRPAGPVVVSVNDRRHWLQEGKDARFLGRAYGSFGIPEDIRVYPYYAEGREDRAQTLASALEQRVVLGLQRDGWPATGAAAPAPLTPAQVRAALASSPASKLLVITLREWFVSLNLNWDSAFTFDWDVAMEVFSADGSSVKHSAKGRDVIGKDYGQSYTNHLRVAYRERLSQLLDEAPVRAALEAAPAAPGVAEWVADPPPAAEPVAPSD